VREGKVTVNGEPARDPAREVDERSRVAVAGEEVRGPERRVVYALNKPLGVLSTARDPGGRPTVVELVPAAGRIYPVGRLDADSTGLIVLTNDGDLAHRMTHPRFEVPKTYRVRVAGGPPSARALRALREGIQLEDGMTAPARVAMKSSQLLEITIHEGRNRQVRRMCEAVGHPVRALERVRFGPLSLGHLPRGAWRRLAPTEVQRLRALL
jgi:23S rRNA pseudouridine2605 synthase